MMGREHDRAIFFASRAYVSLRQNPPEENASKCRAVFLCQGESPASTSRSPEGNGFEADHVERHIACQSCQFWEYMGIFFGLCETKVALGASRLSSS